LSALTFGLILVAALLHATWNVLAKRARGGVAFIWLCFAVSVVAYLPVVVVAYVLLRPRLGPIDAVFIVGNGIIHIAYFLLLQRGYRDGDLSLIYPLARGSGPLLSSIAAVVIFAERPSLLACIGIALVVAGIFIGSAGPAAQAGARANRISIAYGLATGASIAAYTLWDKYSVSTLAISPIVYDYWGNAVRTLLLMPLALTKRAELRETWKRVRSEIVGIAVLSPLAYLLILWALIAAPVSVVAPAREISIVFGAVLGVRLFGEAAGRRRVAAAVVIFAGIAALARG